jgi:hypothetical protein
VVTDPYHCALNAMREGKPTICIGLGAQHPYKAIDDKKKELFYLCFNIKPFYLFLESLLHQSPVELVAGVARVLRDADESIFKGIKRASTQAQQRLINDLEL